MVGKISQVFGGLQTCALTNTCKKSDYRIHYAVYQFFTLKNELTTVHLSKLLNNKHEKISVRFSGTGVGFRL